MFPLPVHVYYDSSRHRRYFQCQGIFHVPLLNETQLTLLPPLGHLNIPSVIIAIVAPINMLLNYLLGKSTPSISSLTSNIYTLSVWGPPSIRLGYIGAPIATAISFNIIAIVSLIMAVFWIPHTAWHPITWKSVREPGAGKGLAWLTWIGIAGVGQTALDWWSWELVGRKSVYRLISPD